MDETERAITRETHRLGRQVIDDAAAVLGARRTLDGLLLSSLAAPGLGGVELRALESYMRSADLTRGQQALARCARAGGKGSV